MKYLKILGLAAVAAMAMTAFTAGSASATTLEVGGVKKTTNTAITASLQSGSSAVLSRTDGSFANTCTASHVDGETTVNTGAAVSGPIKTLTFTNCTRPVSVHNPGSLSVTHTSGTNGTVSSSGAVVTVGSPFGTLNCQTGASTHLGTLTGTGNLAAHATLAIDAVINCGFLVPSAVWKGTYVVTTPTGLGVTS
jgi:hypothetical protein